MRMRNKKLYTSKDCEKMKRFTNVTSKVYTTVIDLIENTFLLVILQISTHALSLPTH
jgi:hypothetical protein